MRNWLIRKMGGIPMPPNGTIFLRNENYIWVVEKDGPAGSAVVGTTDDLIKFLGGVPLPKPEEGKYLRRPAACKMPVRKAKAGAIEQALSILDEHKPGVKEFMKTLNLCDDCGATAAQCAGATPTRDLLSNTTGCNFWRPGVQGVKVDRAGTDSPSPSNTEPGPSSLLGPSKGAGQ